MKRLLVALVLSLCVTCARAQTLQQDLATLVRTPAVTGYEQRLGSDIRARLAKYSPVSDNLGNLYVTLGSGAPHRLIVAPIDEPGYLVSQITEDGYLRVQRLPQQAPHLLFDQLHAAQPVLIETRAGKFVNGVVAGLSTHLQPGRVGAPRVAHPDEMFIDIGAASRAEVRAAGVELLDPLVLDREFYAMGFGKATAPAIGDRFGAATLFELLRRIEPARLRGQVTIAFVTQHWANSRGLDRLTQEVHPDEMVFLGRLRASREEKSRAEPGAGVVLGVEHVEAELTGLGADLKRLADEQGIPIVAEATAPLPRVSYTRGPELPARFAQLGVATAWPVTPAEVLDLGDLEKLVTLLELYVQGPPKPTRGGVGFTGASSLVGDSGWGPGGPQVTLVLQELVQTYGASGYEGPVRETVKSFLPPWAKPETHAAGNLVLRWTAPAGSKPPRLAFVAHLDEIGFRVVSSEADGRLVARSLGGGIVEFFAGHPVLVHTAGGDRPGVLELPQGWEEPNVQWPRGRDVTLRVDVGARSPAQVEQLGIKVGDSLTVPKKYRPLYGTRASARSFDDRVGCAALVAAAWALGQNLKDRDVTFVWSTGEELGLDGALALAQSLAAEGRAPDYVFAVDTFVSSDSPLESKRFADAEIGKGFVIRAVDNSNITRRELVDRVVSIARQNNIPVQFGVTGGGNDGAVFLRYGTINVPISWPLRYSHSPGEVIDTRDLEALARIVSVLARSW